MEQLAMRMQQAVEASEAERLRWVLDERYAPNRLLLEGAAELAAQLFEGLDNTTEAGWMESWELLAFLALGALSPTHAKTDVEKATQDVMCAAVPTVVARVVSPTSNQVDFLAVDVLEAVLEYGPTSLVPEIVDALKRFALRGAEERRVVSTILDDDGTVLP